MKEATKAFRAGKYEELENELWRSIEQLQDEGREQDADWAREVRRCSPLFPRLDFRKSTLLIPTLRRNSSGWERESGPRRRRSST